MSWSNWLYLGVGLGLGVGSRQLFERSKHSDVPSTAPQDDKQDLPALLQQLKASQLAYQLAHEMSQFKAGFLARISHELRSPLNSLIGLHQLILSDLCDDPAEEREFVAQAHKSALKLVKLIDEILDVARTEHGTNKLEIQPLQLASVLQSVYQLTHLLAVNRNFRLQVSPPDSEIYILADPRWLRQVLVNLVETCIANMEEGSICISAQPASAAETSLHIWLDVELPTSTWSEPVDLMQSISNPSELVNQNIKPSLGLTLLLNQTLLEVMKCRLEILPIPPAADESRWTRIQLAIPLLIPETASLWQEEN